MKRIATCVVMSAFVVFFTGFSAEKTPKKAPHFSLKTADGTVIDLSKLKGKTIVVNFWATWCGPCRAEIPAFLEVYEKYKSKGLEIVGISLDQGGWSDVTPFVKKFNIVYPVVIGDEKLTKQYGGVDAIPTTFIIDKNGVIVDKHVGGLRKENLENLIKGIL